MEYKIIREFCKTEWAEMTYSGVTEAKLDQFSNKFKTLIKQYKKLHPINYLLIRVIPFFKYIF